MSKFFKALEQAERERVLREQGRHADGHSIEIEQLAPERPRQTEASSGMPVSGDSVFEGRRRRRRDIDRSTSQEAATDLDGHLVSLISPTSFGAEQYRGLRHIVEQLRQTADLRVLAVSSPRTGDGKTTTAINLAGALAQSPETRVLLVDADLRQPSVREHLNLGESGARGLVDVVLDSALSLDDVIRRCPSYNLAVLPAGRPPASEYELLQSPRLQELLEAARSRYDYIVMDTPPLIPIPDCRVIATLVNGFLVVVAAHRTPRKLVEEALSVLDPGKIVGLVFNQDDDLPLHYYRTYAGLSPNGRGAGWRDRATRMIGRSRRGHYGS